MSVLSCKNADKDANLFLFIQYSINWNECYYIRLEEESKKRKLEEKQRRIEDYKKSSSNGSGGAKAKKVKKKKKAAESPASEEQDSSEHCSVKENSAEPVQPTDSLGKFAFDNKKEMDLLLRVYSLFYTFRNILGSSEIIHSFSKIIIYRLSLLTSMNFVLISTHLPFT